MPEAHHHHSLDEDTAQIMAEHQHLREVLTDLEACRDVPRLTQLLGELRALLVAHFEHEERADGILSDVQAHAPQNVDALAAILDEHAGFLTTVDGLIADAKACLDGPMAELFEGVQKLKHDPHDHEARESEIFLDAIYTDMGGAD